MKKKILALLLLILVSTNSYANIAQGQRRYQNNQPVTVHLDSTQILVAGQTSGRLDYPGLTTTPSLIYSITLTATASNATLAIFDSPIAEYGVPGGVIIEPIWELAVATSGNSQVAVFNPPIPTFSGISITVKNGTADISYE